MDTAKVCHEDDDEFLFCPIMNPGPSPLEYILNRTVSSFHIKKGYDKSNTSWASCAFSFFYGCVGRWGLLIPQFWWTTSIHPFAIFHCSVIRITVFYFPTYYCILPSSRNDNCHVIIIRIFMLQLILVWITCDIVFIEAKSQVKWRSLMFNELNTLTK